MPLVFSGEQGGSESFEMLLEAHDGDKRVVVVTSSEAIEDHGIDKVEAKASDKYDAGHFDQNGRIKVLTGDL